MPARKTPGPSVKDPERYEALRDQGASKEKAARIANAVARDGAEAVGRRGGTSPSYDEWTVADLRQRARELDVPGRSGMNKSALVEALRAR